MPSVADGTGAASDVPARRDNGRQERHARAVCACVRDESAIAVFDDDDGKQRGRRRLREGLAGVPIFDESVRQLRAGEVAPAPEIVPASAFCFTADVASAAGRLPRAPMGRLVRPERDSPCRRCGALHGVYTSGCLPLLFSGCPQPDEEIGISGFARAREIAPVPGMLVIVADVRTDRRYQAITDAYSAREDAAQIAAWLTEWQIMQPRDRAVIGGWQEARDEPD
jgi:hypothetical protein